MFRPSGYNYPSEDDQPTAGPSGQYGGPYGYLGAGPQIPTQQHGYSQSTYAPPLLMYSTTVPNYRPPRAYPPANERRYLSVFVQNVFVGIRIPMVARLSITDYRGNVVLDTYVRPIRAVTDYRTAETGLYPEHLSSGRPFDEIQRDVANIIRDRILVGYCLWDFLSVMGTSHPAIDTRDVALFLPFRQTLRAKKMVPLSTLVDRLMRRNIGTGLEDPLENARAALDLFRSCEDVWEDMIRSGSWPCSLPPSTYARYFT